MTIPADEITEPLSEDEMRERLIAIKATYGASGLSELKIGASVQIEETGAILECRPLSSATPEERATLRYSCLFCFPVPRAWDTEEEMRRAHYEHSMRIRAEHHVWCRYSPEAGLFSKTEWKP